MPLFASAESAGDPPALFLLLVGAYLVFLLGCALVTPLKGKWGFLLAGILIHWFWIFGALRLAKPNSFWARRFYDEKKLQQAQARFGGESRSKRCPDCAERINADARVCRYCGFRFALPADLEAPHAAVAAAAPVLAPPPAAEPAAAQRERNWGLPAALVLAALVAAALTLAIVLIGNDSSKDGDEGPPTPPPPAATPPAAPTPAKTGPGERRWQAIKHGFEHNYPIKGAMSKRLHFVVPAGGLYVRANKPPDPDVVVRIEGQQIDSYEDAPTKANERMWPINISGRKQLEISLINGSFDDRVFHVGFFEVDASLLERRWDQVPGVPTGGNNPGSSSFAQAPADRYQRLELYSDGTPGSLLGQSFDAPAGWRTAIQLYPDFTPGSCFTVRLRSPLPARAITTNGHRNVASLLGPSASAGVLRWRGKFGGDSIAPRIILMLRNTTATTQRLRIEFSPASC